VYVQPDGSNDIDLPPAAAASTTLQQQQQQRSPSNGFDWFTSIVNSRKRTLQRANKMTCNNNINETLAMEMNGGASSNLVDSPPNHVLNNDESEEIHHIRHLRRRKMALEVEKMELDNTKLKLEIKLLQLKVEKERRSLE